MVYVEDLLYDIERIGRIICYECYKQETKQYLETPRRLLERISANGWRVNTETGHYLCPKCMFRVYTR